GFHMDRVRSVAIFALLAGLPAFHADLGAAQHEAHGGGASSALVETVRRATEQFRDVRNASPDYGPVLGCVSGPEAGAMGVHFVNPALLMDGAVEGAPPDGVHYVF